jgi:Holliday junction DNA helicase RuvA
MLAFLTGKIILHRNSTIILRLTSGAGYLVNVDPGKRYLVGENIELFILEVKREDKNELFGFEILEDQEWVEKLVKVSGVGPKTAANVVWTLGIEQINEAIRKNDAKILGQVKGLGAKTAKKIILELKGATTDVAELDKKMDLNSNFALDFVDTLGGLGYKRGEIVAIITKLKTKNLWDENDLVETVRSGLRELGRG